jgi:hypothetical protein
MLKFGEDTEESLIWFCFRICCLSNLIILIFKNLTLSGMSHGVLFIGYVILAY